MADTAPPAAPSAPTATTPVATPDGSTPPVAAPVSAQPGAISTEDAVTQIDKIDQWEQLQDILEGRKPSEIKAGQPDPQSSATAPTPAPAAAAPATAAAAAPAQPEPGENDVIEDAGEALPKNFRFHTEDKQRSRYLKLLRQRPEANPIDLAIEAGYAPAQAPVAAAAAPVAPQPVADHPDVVRLKDEIKQLAEKKAEHKKAYEFGDADDLAEQITDKKLELQRLEDTIEAEQAFDQEYRGGYQSARQQAVAKYPDTAVNGTPQSDELKRERAFLEQTEPGFFDDPGYPLALLERLEKRRPDLFKGGQAASAPAPAAPIVQTPPNAVSPNKAARPVGEVAAGREGAVQPLGKEEATKAIENMSLEELTALGDQVGTKPKSANRGRTPGIIRGR